MKLDFLGAYSWKATDGINVEVNAHPRTNADSTRRWHLGTGLGAYFYISECRKHVKTHISDDNAAWGIWLRHCLNGRQDEYELNWPTLFTSLPRIVRSKKTVQNGTTTKKVD